MKRDRTAVDSGFGDQLLAQQIGDIAERLGKAANAAQAAELLTANHRFAEARVLLVDSLFETAAASALVSVVLQAEPSSHAEERA